MTITNIDTMIRSLLTANPWLTHRSSGYLSLTLTRVGTFRGFRQDQNLPIVPTNHGEMVDRNDVYIGASPELPRVPAFKLLCLQALSRISAPDSTIDDLWVNSHQPTRSGTLAVRYPCDPPEAYPASVVTLQSLPWVLYIARPL